MICIRLVLNIDTQIFFTMKLLKWLSTYTVFLVIISGHAQVGIGNTDPKATLDITVTDPDNPSATDGILIPRVNTLNITSPNTDQDGMLVYLTTDVTISTVPYSKGFYYWDDGTNTWTQISGAKQINDLNDGISDGSSVFLGANSGINDDLSGNQNIAVGSSALQDNISGFGNIAIGDSSLNNSTGDFNTAIGTTSLFSNTSGSSNVAIGGASLQNNTTGSGNIAIGAFAGRYTNGSGNVVIGDLALEENVGGSNNVAIGNSAANQNYDASGSIFIGNQAGYNETSGNRLYIENSDSNADNALIYGEFDNNILRTNSEFQIGNPTVNGYSFPISDGTTDQILSTNGAGILSFTDASALFTDTNTTYDGTDFALSNQSAPVGQFVTGITAAGTIISASDNDSQTLFLSGSTLGISNGNSVNLSGTDSQSIDNFSFNTSTNELTLEIENDGLPAQIIDLSSLSNPSDADWHEEGTNAGPNNISDNIFTQGRVGIGDITPDSTLDVDYSGSDIDAVIIDYTSTSNVIGSSFSNIPGALKVNTEATSSNRQLTSGAFTLTGTMAVGLSVSAAIGIQNTVTTQDDTSGLAIIVEGESDVSYGINNSVISSPSNTNFGTYNQVSGASISNYGGWFRANGSSTTNYGIRAEAFGATTNWAAYFGLGDVYIQNGLEVDGSFNFTDGNESLGYVLSTDALGNASWINPSTIFTDTDDQTISLSGTNLSITNGNTISLATLQDGIGTDNQTIDEFSLSGSTLSLSLEDDGQPNLTVDLSSLNSSNTLDQAYNQGGPGNGRIINATEGAFVITGEDGFSVSGTHGFGATISTGLQTKMFFNPRKSAFRAGYVDTNQWNDANVGEYSVAFGENTTASGEVSTAIGRNNNSTGDLSFTGGFSNNASGAASMAFGISTIASGSFSTTLGNNTLARSYAEVVIGRFNNIYSPVGATSWDYSDQVFVIGNGTNANRGNALTIFKNGLMNINDEYNMPLTDGTPGQVMTTNGSGIVSFEDPSTVFTDTDDQTLSLSGTTLSIDNGNSINLNTISENTTASNGLTEVGNDIRLGGTLTQDTTIDYGNFDTRLNLNGTGDFIIQDNGTDVFMVDSDGNTNVGNTMQWRENAINGTIIGQMLEDGNDGRFIVRENGNIAVDLRTNTGYVFNQQGFDRDFRIESDDQENMLFVDANTNRIGMGTGVPEGTLHVLSNSGSTSPQIRVTENNDTDGGRITFNNTVQTNNYWTLYGRSRDNNANSRFNIYNNATGNIVIIKGDGDAGFQGTPNADLHVYHNNISGSDGFKLQNQGGNNNWWRMFTSNADGRLYLYSTLGGPSSRGNFNNNTGVYSSTSDRRLKKDFKPLSFTWESFMQLETLSYLYKTQNDSKRSLGLIAQDVALIYPELVSYNAKDDIYHMNYSGFGVIAIKAAQELKEEINILKIENAKLKAKLDQLKSIEARLTALESKTETTQVDTITKE